MLRRLLLSLVVLGSAAAASAQTSYVPVATWLNDPAHQDDGDQLMAALHVAGIEAVATCSAGCTLSVPSADFVRAIGLANATIARDHLDVSVIVPPTN